MLSAHSRKTLPGISSRPAALCDLMSLSNFFYTGNRNCNVSYAWYLLRLFADSWTFEESCKKYQTPTHTHTHPHPPPTHTPTPPHTHTPHTPHTHPPTHTPHTHPPTPPPHTTNQICVASTFDIYESWCVITISQDLLIQGDLLYVHQPVSTVMFSDVIISLSEVPS